MGIFGMTSSEVQAAMDERDARLHRRLEMLEAALDRLAGAKPAEQKTEAKPSAHKPSCPECNIGTGCRALVRGVSTFTASLGDDTHLSGITAISTGHKGDSLAMCVSCGYQGRLKDFYPTMHQPEKKDGPEDQKTAKSRRKRKGE